MNMQVLGIVGSLRRESYNRRLLEHAASHAPEGMGIAVAVDPLRLPLFDEDLEAAGLPPEVAAGQEAIRTADGVIVASPEYNFGVPGPVKNWLDWMSRPPGRGPWRGKPVLLMGASTGRTGGTVQCQGQLRISLAVLGAHVVAHPPVLVAEAASRFDGDVLVDETAVTVVATALARLGELIERAGRG